MYFNPSSIFTLGISHYDRLQSIRCWCQDLRLYGGPRYVEALEYFSIWTLLLFPIPFQTRLFQLVKYNMILQTCIGGFYITYVNPKIIHVHYLLIDIDRFLLQCIDFLAHHSLVILHSLLFNKVFPPRSFFEYYIMNMPFTLYCLSYDIHHKYGLSYRSDMILLFCIYHIILLLFYI